MTRRVAFKEAWYYSPIAGERDRARRLRFAGDPTMRMQWRKRDGRSGSIGGGGFGHDLDMILASNRALPQIALDG